MIAVMNKNYATYDSLMRHMRSSGIKISGSTQKSQLRLIGYYHGYKGYRFNKIPSRRIPFTTYNELHLVITFDETIKSIMYQPIMQLESAIKSICCDEIVTKIKSDSFAIAFEKAMSKSKTTDEVKKRIKCRDTIYAAMTKRFEGNGRIVPHYYKQDRYIPLWGIIEELMLGELSEFIQTLQPSIKIAISEEFGIPSQYNTDGALLSKLILGIKDFRNAIAHNKVIFDGRYIEFKKRASISTMLQNQSHIKSIPFDSVFDDIILIIFLMKGCRFSKIQLLSIVNKLLVEVDKLHQKLPYDIFKEVVAVDTYKKLEDLRKYVHKREL